MHSKEENKITSKNSASGQDIQYKSNRKGYVVHQKENKVSLSWLWLVCMDSREYILYSVQYTLQGKSHLSIPFLGIARPQSQFPHSCVCEQFIYSQDRSAYFPAAE